MPDAPAPASLSALGALALAVRERLLSGGAAVLPGIGTLARVHVPARVQARPDGGRVLLPPGETVGLTGAGGDAAPLAALVVRHLGTLQADPAAALRAALDQLEARLAATGGVPLPGVGAFQRTSGGVRFAPEPAFLSAVNRPFAGLPPVGTPAGAPETPPTDAPEPLPELPDAARALDALPEGSPSPVTTAASGPESSTVLGVPVLSVAAPPLGSDTPGADGSDRPPMSGRYVPVDAVPPPMTIEPEPPAAEPAPRDESAGDAPDAAPVPETESATLSANDASPVRDVPPPAEWTAPPEMPPPGTLGLPDPIEDADYSVLGAPAEPNRPAEVSDPGAPDEAPPVPDALPIPEEPMAAGTAAPEPAPVSPAHAVGPLGDPARARWHQALGWLLIAVALGLATALWVLSRYDAPRRATPPADAPAARPSTLVVPDDVAPTGTVRVRTEPPAGGSAVGGPFGPPTTGDRESVGLFTLRVHTLR